MQALQTQLDQARTAERLSQEKIAALLERVSHFEAELPRIEALRDAYKNEIEEFKKREEDPALLRENENRLFDTFVTSLEELNLNETAKQQAQESNEANVGLLAKVSAGKSMIANALNGGQVKVAQTGSMLYRNPSHQASLNYHSLHSHWRMVLQLGERQLIHR